MNAHRASWSKVILLAIAACLVAGCQAINKSSSGPASTSGVPHEVSVQPVSLTTEDKLKLAGTLYLSSQANTAVVLAHQFTAGADQRTWQPFARLIAEKGFTALTFDFRGRGQSEGPLKEILLPNDIHAAIDLVASRGYKRVVCIGASLGGTTCLRAAVDRNLAGLVIISSPMSAYGMGVGPADLAQLKMPKLFICAQDDTSSGYRWLDSINSMYQLAADPKAIHVFPGTAHGTLLFDTPSGNEFRDIIVGFLEGLQE